MMFSWQQIVYKEAWTLAALLNLVLLCVLWVAALVMKYLHVTNSEVRNCLASSSTITHCIVPLLIDSTHFHLQFSLISSSLLLVLILF